MLKAQYNQLVGRNQNIPNMMPENIYPPKYLPIHLRYLLVARLDSSTQDILRDNSVDICRTLAAKETDN